MRSLFEFVRWYDTLNKIQKVLVIVGLLVIAWVFIVVVTHEPSERPRRAKIVLNCDHCGVDPTRTITYNKYMDQKEQQQQNWFQQEKQRIQQEIWDERGRQRWCRQHPQDINCKGIQ